MKFRLTELFWIIHRFKYRHSRLRGNGEAKIVDNPQPKRRRRTALKLIVEFTQPIRSTLLCITSLSLLNACALGPDYVRPTPIITADMPDSFKENWKPAQPQDQAIPQKWWTMFNDDNLNTLIEQIPTSNLTLAQAEANYREALALVDNASAAYFPSITGAISKTRSRNSSASSSTVRSGINSINSLSTTVGWEIDLWGKIRRTVEAQENTALSGFANVQSTLLSMQSQLAQNYFQLRVLDAQKELLDRTVEEYQRSLTLTQNQYQSGVVAPDSVLLAETQLKSAQAQALDVGIQRAQFEHAIAVLVGKPPSAFSIPMIPIGDKDYLPDLPDVPIGIPSSLLERRPDVAAAERLVAAANAQIGVTKAAYFPSLTLSAGGGFQSNQFADWLTVPNRVWSVGPSLSGILFDAGARRALNQQAIANYDASVANYRQTVLTAFQNVEDNLVALRILKDESEVQNLAVISARKALEVTLNQYKAGTVNYLNVVTAQTTALSNERTKLSVTNSRLVASVKLIVALGGGWDGMKGKYETANVVTNKQ